MADTKETKGVAFVPVPLQLLGKTTTGPTQVVENMQNPVLRQQAKSALADVGDAAGWASTLGGAALLFTPAAPEGAVLVAQGLGALGAGAYLGEGALDAVAGEYKQAAAKAGLALVDAATPSARKGSALLGPSVKRGVRPVILQPAVGLPLMDATENFVQDKMRDEPYQGSDTSYADNPYRTARLPGDMPVDIELVGAMPRNAR